PAGRRVKELSTVEVEAPNSVSRHMSGGSAVAMVQVMDKTVEQQSMGGIGMAWVDPEPVGPAGWVAPLVEAGASELPNERGTLLHPSEPGKPQEWQNSGEVHMPSVPPMWDEHDAGAGAGAGPSDGTADGIGAGRLAGHAAETWPEELVQHLGGYKGEGQGATLLQQPRSAGAGSCSSHPASEFAVQSVSSGAVSPEPVASGLCPSPTNTTSPDPVTGLGSDSLHHYHPRGHSIATSTATATATG
ncbi:unnamed protein product, partial [Chrysoparadoxa australica]